MPIEISSELYLAVSVVIGTFLIAWVWLRSKKEKATRRKFLGQFPAESLRMHPTVLGVVYHVLEQNAEGLRVQVVWTTYKKAQNGKIYEFPVDALIPFNSERF